jgi:16S rRNA (adenine1518-N6/adenine1519-N6)-dimethyltransferase
MAQFNFKKKYGQNFLNNDNVKEKIVTSINPTEDDLIIEIGPGGGAITSKLKRYSSQILAFEIDEDTKKFLTPLEDDRTHIVYKDFLSIDVKKYLENYKYNHLYIIGNLPYYITTPILEHIVDSNIEPESLTIMVQKEVADRFLAQPKNKEYGYMTVILNYNFKVEKIVDVDRKYFYPVPNVDSTVIKLSKREKEQVDYDKFKKLLKDSFQFKRKTINNNLKNYDKNKVNEVLLKHGYNLQNRAEELDLDTFIDLSNNL